MGEEQLKCGLITLNDGDVRRRATLGILKTLILEIFFLFSIFKNVLTKKNYFKAKKYRSLKITIY
jgi:hypothetical protein